VFTSASSPAWPMTSSTTEDRSTSLAVRNGSSSLLDGGGQTLSWKMLPEGAVGRPRKAIPASKRSMSSSSSSLTFRGLGTAFRIATILRLWRRRHTRAPASSRRMKARPPKALPAITPTRPGPANVESEGSLSEVTTAVNKVETDPLAITTDVLVREIAPEAVPAGVEESWSALVLVGGVDEIERLVDDVLKTELDEMLDEDDLDEKVEELEIVEWLEDLAVEDELLMEELELELEVEFAATDSLRNPVGPGRPLDDPIVFAIRSLSPATSD